MAVLSLTDAHLAYGDAALLDGASFSLEAGERLALIGRNGSGKSSLLKLLAGSERLDDGLLQRTQGLTVRYVPQEPVFDPDATVFDVVADGVAEARSVRAAYEAHAPGVDLDALQTRIEQLDGWNWELRVAAAIDHLALGDGARRVGTLSGGTLKRVALAQALVALPDVLLLDEPTNHLDLDAIVWLQQLLVERRGALVVVSHDRAFIDAVATRIVELDRGVLRSYPGRYRAYEATKASELAAEALADARADKLLAQEEVWVRQGVEARRTRAVGRVARLERLRAARLARRQVVGQARLALDRGEASGKLVAELDNATLRFEGGPMVVDRFSATVLRGDKIGLVGPNGSGKTSLLKLMLGQLAPTSGTVRRGTRLQVAYFDQLRAGLDLDATLADTISPGSEWVEVAGASGKTVRKHVKSYLADFLFSPARAASPVRTLSGGERNRLLLARLFALPANLLVLDEPTNDLDIETLELLEALLQDYAGTVFLVSHDRTFVDRVVTSLIVSEGEGRWREFEGGIEDWLLQRERSAAPAMPAAAPVAASERRSASAPSPAAAAPRASRKLGFKQQRELDALPARIEALEDEQRMLGERLADAALYTDEPQRVAEVQARYEAIEAELLEALERWVALQAS